ncbi:SIMPL domain-containing protein [Chitinilyticum litopenaei]|uniref:SIMPL domain-containing protein n=1 Tax=Chitinilyticum litopenaei TaxID=1121276 RepID=UPI00041987F4|nr:SIMPL domain-containing protein [Chitinilyticum litopenaei]
MKLSALALTLCLAAPAIAAEAPLFNVVNFETTAVQAVENDLAMAVLFVESSDTDPGKLAERINQTLAQALKRVQQVSEVQSKGTGYSTYPQYNNKTGKQDGWRSRGELRVASRDFAALSKLIGELQKPQGSGLSLQLESVNYSVSDERRSKTEDLLIEEGLRQFRQRAALLQKQLQGQGWKLLHVNVNTGGMPPPMPYARKAMAVGMAAEAAPPLESGESRLSVQVSGAIQIE